MRAIDQFEEPDGWLEMIRTAMSRDFGWEQSAAKYLSLYQRVVLGPSWRAGTPAQATQSV